MPVDPSVALHVTGPGTGLDDPGKGTAVSPLGQVQNFADTMAKLNSIKQFNQEFAAKQRLGQIMANSPDLPTALKNISQDPSVAGFLPEVITNLSSANRVNEEAKSIGQKRRQDAFGAGASVIQGMLVDPESAERNLPAILGNIPDPTDRDFAEKNVRTLMKGINDGLDKFDDTPGQNGGPSPRKQEMAKRILAAGYQTGSQDALTKQLPAPGMVTGPFGPGGATATIPGTVGSATPTILGRAPGSFQAAGGGGTGRAGGGNPISLTGPSQTEEQYFGHRGADIADYEKNLDDRVLNGGVLRKNVGEVVNAAKEAAVGGGADIYAKLGTALQALGVSNDTVDKWANGSLAASQVVDKVALQNSMAQLKQQLTGVGGSRMNAQEFVTYLNKNPNLTTDPRAMVQVFNLWNQFFDKDKSEQSAFNKFKSGKSTGDKGLDEAIKSTGKRDPGQWPSLWSHSDFMDEFAPGGAISGAGVKTNSGPISGDLPDDIKALIAKHK